MKNIVYAAYDREGIIAIFLYRSDCIEYCDNMDLAMCTLTREEILDEF